MLWRLFSLLTIAVAVRPMMDDSSNTKVSVGKKFCRLFPEKGAGDCLEQVRVQGGWGDGQGPEDMQKCLGKQVNNNCLS